MARPSWSTSRCTSEPCTCRDARRPCCPPPSSWSACGRWPHAAPGRRPPMALTLPGATDATNVKTIAVRWGVDDLPDPCALVTRRTVRSLLDNGPDRSTAQRTGVRERRAAAVQHLQLGRPRRPSRRSDRRPDRRGEHGTRRGREKSVVGPRPRSRATSATTARRRCSSARCRPGGAAGSSIFFRHRGWSVLIGHVGDAAASLRRAHWCSLRSSITSTPCPLPGTDRPSGTGTGYAHTYARRMGARSYVLPRPGDDLAAIAAREMPDVEDAERQLMSWNLHLAARRSIGLLPSDIVFLEPPPAR